MILYFHSMIFTAKSFQEKQILQVQDRLLLYTESPRSDCVSPWKLILAGYNFTVYVPSFPITRHPEEIMKEGGTNGRWMWDAGGETARRRESDETLWRMAGCHLRVHTAFLELPKLAERRPTAPRYPLDFWEPERGIAQMRLHVPTNRGRRKTTMKLLRNDFPPTYLIPLQDHSHCSLKKKKLVLITDGVRGAHNCGWPTSGNWAVFSFFF